MPTTRSFPSSDGKSHLTKSAVPADVSSLGLLGIFHRTAKMRGNPDSRSHLLVVQSAPSVPLGKITEWAHRHTERLHKAQYPALLLVIEAKANLLLI
jgi:hypothetical protein